MRMAKTRKSLSCMHTISTCSVGPRQMFCDTWKQSHKKQSVDKESLSATICLKWSIMYYWEKLISKFSFFCYSYFICWQGLDMRPFEVSKIFVNNIVLNSIASEPAWENPNWSPGPMYWRRGHRAKVFLQFCQEVSLPYSQTPCEYTYTCPCRNCLGPSKHWGLAKQVQYSSHSVSSQPVL